MPLPANGTLWPPEQLKHITPAMATWDAWWTGTATALELERLEPQPGPLFIEAARFASAAPAGGIATVIFGLADPYEDGV